MLKNDPLSTTEQIDQHAASAGKGALIGGITGLAARAITGSIVYADRSFLEWLVDEINGGEFEHTLNKPPKSTVL